MIRLVKRVITVICTLILVIFGILFLYSHLKIFDHVYVRRISLLDSEKKRSPKIVLVGGSNLLFSINTELLQKSLNIPVFNTGYFGGYPISFYIEDAIRDLRPGDYLIACPEYENYMGTWFKPKKDLYKFILANFFEKSSLLLHEEKIEYYTSIVSNFIEIMLTLVRSMNFSADLFPINDSKWNRFIDFTDHYKAPKQAIVFDIATGSINENPFEYLKMKQLSLEKLGIHFYLDSAALSLTSYEKNQAYMEKIQETIEQWKLPYLSKITDSLFRDAEVFNTAYHLNQIGAERRTMLLAERITKLMQRP